MINNLNINLNNSILTRRKNPQPKISFAGQNKFADFSAAQTELPQGERNYCLFNQNKVNFIVSQKEHAIPYLKETLKSSNDEKEIVETLYIIDKLAENKTKGIPALYPYLAKFNDTKSPNIQTFLAGIYRKTQVPDGFGPLVSMLIRNAMNSKNVGLANPTYEFATPQKTFDPNEEIGGAILAYIENYSHNPPKIDYRA